MVTTDPRMQAPPRLSDLPRDEMVRALVARDAERRRLYMARFIAGQARRTARAWLGQFFRVSAAMGAAEPAPPVFPPAGGAADMARRT